MARKFVGIFVFWHNLFREASSLSFEEQIMSQDKNPGIFSRQIAAIVLIILQIFSHNARRFESEIGEYH